MLLLKSFLALAVLSASTLPFGSFANDRAGDDASVPGLFEAEQSAVLSAERSGVLRSVKAAAGDRVKKGATLFSVDSSDLRNELSQAKIQLQYAQSKLNRQDGLRKRGMASPAALAEAQLERDLAKAAIARLNGLIRQSNTRAPYSAVVVQQLAKNFEWVNAGDPVLAIVNPNKLRLTAAVPAITLQYLAPGQTYRARVPALSDGWVDVTLAVIPPEVESQSDTAELIWNVANIPEGLLAGMKGQLQIPAVWLEEPQLGMSP